jgi:nicotinate-nucleotide adenylyltransferase
MTSTAAGAGSAATGRRGIGVLGGAFNPPHVTHRRLAASALEHLPIDEVRVIPAGDHPHKRHRDMAPAVDRLAMCRLAFAGLPGVVVDPREVQRDGPSFTVDTLAELAAEHARRRLWLLIGSDNLPLLPTWRDPERILALATIVTYPRLHHPATRDALARAGVPPALHAALLGHVLPLPADAIAASELRARWRAGERDLPELAPAVRDYLAAHDLYR